MIDWKILELVTALSKPAGREIAVKNLAHALGGEYLVVLLRDPELGVHLPAPRFPQTLPRGREWQELCKDAIASGTSRGELSFPEASVRHQAIALSAPDESVLILLGGDPDLASLTEVQQLLPLLCATFQQEFINRITAGNALLAYEAANQARALSSALESVRRDLITAVVDRDLALQSGHMGTWRWEPSNNRAFWSEMQERLFGLSPGTYDGTEETFLGLVEEEDRPKIKQWIAHSIATGEPYSARYRVLWPNGERHWLEAHGSVLRNEHGEVTVLTGVSWDITEQRSAEEALARQAEELARSNADLQQFAYVTSHDLQEPLRNIIIYAQLLSRRFEGQLDSESSQFLEYIISSGRRMAELVQGLLSFSQVTNADEIPPESVCLNDVLYWARMNLSAAIEKSGAELSFDPLPKVLGNSVQLVQLLQNLISNAIKYRSDKPPLIQVSARWEGSEWVISVQDNGMGILPEYHERIFGVFKRLHGQQIPGTGIGLAICKKIVEKHGGRIWVESGPDAGARFVFTLPGVPAEAHPGSDSPEHPAQDESETYASQIKNKIQ